MYERLAEVYEFLVPKALLTPAGSAAALDAFTHDELLADLEAAGLAPMADTWTPEPEPYLVTSRAKSSNASR